MQSRGPIDFGARTAVRDGSLKLITIAVIGAVKEWPLDLQGVPCLRVAVKQIVCFCVGNPPDSVASFPSCDAPEDLIYKELCPECLKLRLDSNSPSK